MKQIDLDQTKTKKQIFAAAVKEFAEKGFAGARMGSIARRAQVNQALIHYYFNTKETLYKTILIKLFGVDYADAFIDRIKQIGEEHNLTPSQQLYLKIYVLINVNLELHNPDFGRIIMREMSENRGKIKEIVIKYLLPRYDSFESVIKKGVEEGEFETKNTFYVVLGLHTFIINYLNTKEVIEESGWRDKLSLDKEKRSLLEFLTDNTFKSLRPDNKPLSIPVIPETVLKSVNQLIDEFNSEIKSELFYDDSR